MKRLSAALNSNSRFNSNGSSLRRIVEQAKKYVGRCFEDIPDDVLKYNIFSYNCASFLDLRLVNKRFNEQVNDYWYSTLMGSFNKDNCLAPFKPEVLPVDFLNVPPVFRMYFLYAVQHLNDPKCKEYVRLVLLCVECAIDTIPEFGRDVVGELRKTTTKDNRLSAFLIEFLKRYGKKQESQNKDLPPVLIDFLKSLESETLKKEFQLGYLSDCVNSPINLYELVESWKKSGSVWDVCGHVYKFIIDNKFDTHEFERNDGSMIFKMENNKTVLVLDERNGDESVKIIGRFAEQFMLNSLNRSDVQLYAWQVFNFLSSYAKVKSSKIISKIIFYFYNRRWDFFKNFQTNNKFILAYQFTALEGLLEIVKRDLMDPAQYACLKDFILRETPADEWRIHLQLMPLLNELLINGLVEICNDEEANLCKRMIVNVLKNYEIIDRYVGEYLNDWKSFDSLSSLFNQLYQSKTITISKNEGIVLKNYLFDIRENMNGYNIHIPAINFVIMLLDEKIIEIDNSEKNLLKTWVLNDMDKDYYSSSQFYTILRSNSVEENDMILLKTVIFDRLRTSVSMRESIHSCNIALFLCLLENNLVTLVKDDVNFLNDYVDKLLKEKLSILKLNFYQDLTNNLNLLIYYLITHNLRNVGDHESIRFVGTNEWY